MKNKNYELCQIYVDENIEIYPLICKNQRINPIGYEEFVSIMDVDPSEHYPIFISSLIYCEEFCINICSFTRNADIAFYKPYVLDIIRYVNHCYAGCYIHSIKQHYINNDFKERSFNLRAILNDFFSIGNTSFDYMVLSEKIKSISDKISTENIVNTGIEKTMDVPGFLYDNLKATLSNFVNYKGSNSEKQFKKVDEVYFGYKLGRIFLQGRIELIKSNSK